jgi:uncharacterized membrane protein
MEAPMTAIAFIIFTFCWLVLAAIALLAIGFSGYEILSLSAFGQELQAFDSNIFNRLFVWAVLLINPVTVGIAFIGSKIRRRRGPL